MAFANDAHRAVLTRIPRRTRRERPPVNSGRAALLVHDVIDAVLQSSRDHAPSPFANAETVHENHRRPRHRHLARPQLRHAEDRDRRGPHGIGDATLNGRELAVASYLTDHVIPTLIGRDAGADRGHLAIPLPRRVLAARAGDDERDRRRRHRAVGHQGARSPGLPLYQLLGGASRDGVMVYGHANGNDIAETLDEVARYIDLGYKAIRAQCGIPGLRVDLRRGEGQDVLRAGRRGDPDRERLVDARSTSTMCRKLFDAIRARFGFDHHLLHDVHHRLTPIEAARLGKIARALPPVLDGGPDAGREPGRRSA